MLCAAAALVRLWRSAGFAVRAACGACAGGVESAACGAHGVWMGEESGDGGCPQGFVRRWRSSSLRSAHRLCGPCGRGGAWGLVSSPLTARFV